MMGIAYNPRMRYLTGLSGPPWPVVVPNRRRRGLSAYNPRMRYLTGFRLGDGSDVNATYPVYDTATPDYSAQTLTPALSVPSGPILSPTDYNITGQLYSNTDIVSPSNPPTTGFSTNPAISVVSPAAVATARQAAASSGWFSQVGSLGISNGTILLGLGGIVLFAAVASSGGRR